MTKRLKKVNIVKTENSWEIVDLKNNTIGSCEDIRRIMEIALYSYKIMNMTFALDELMKVELNII